MQNIGKQTLPIVDAGRKHGVAKAGLFTSPGICEQTPAVGNQHGGSGGGGLSDLATLFLEVTRTRAGPRS